MNHAHILFRWRRKDIADLGATNITNLGHKVVTPTEMMPLSFVQDQGKMFLDLFVLDRVCFPVFLESKFCKFLRMYTETKSKPILMLTAMTSPEQIVEGCRGWWLRHKAPWNERPPRTYTCSFASSSSSCPRHSQSFYDCWNERG